MSNVPTPQMYSKFAFEVGGKVQGVSFRAYTKSHAKRLGLVGWVMNTTQGTVVGECQGEGDSCKSMKNWLETQGSPASRIAWCKFKNETDLLPKLQYVEFKIRK
ncbi:unnamed protein product [Pedinophyceae sp. YPF-701]|nr:unnamed protein product [Pedinophyceae sp. YPF-701]